MFRIFSSFRVISYLEFLCLLKNGYIAPLWFLSKAKTLGKEPATQHATPCTRARIHLSDVDLLSPFCQVIAGSIVPVTS